MRSIIVFIALYFVLSLLGCQDSKDDLRSVHPDHIAYKSIGQQIPYETGVQWIEAYQEMNNNKQGRLISLEYQITASQLEALLQSVSNLVGVAFHYALDESGKQHILIIPVDESLSVWNSTPGRIIVDANSDSIINQSTAEIWAQSYKDVHPEGIWFHFFGADLFDEIFDIPFFTTLDIQPVINTLNLLPQMLLIVWDLSSDLNIGRTMRESGRIFDASNPCPPCSAQ
jgi:hypothetical protein